MNERVMQFRIGMFVIVAGLVLTMMIVWFGESPSIFRDQVYLKVHYTEAPGVRRGRSRPQERHPDRRGLFHRLRRAAQRARRRDRDPGARAQISAAQGVRAPAEPVADRRRHGRYDAGHRPGFSTTGDTPARRPGIEGEVAPDPSKALAAATKAFEKPATRSKRSTRPPPAWRRSPRVPTSSTTSWRRWPTPARTSPRPPRGSTE